MNTLTHSVVRGREQRTPLGSRTNPWTPPVLRQTSFWHEASARAERWFCRGMEAAREQVWPWLRKAGRFAWRLRRQAQVGVQDWIKLRVPGAAVAARTRQLAVEERLSLGPKQHLYLVRCGQTHLLVGSAGEGALQWMIVPAEQSLPDSGERPSASARVKAPAPVAGKMAARRRAAPKSAGEQECAR